MINISAYLKMRPSIWYGRLHFRGKGRFIRDTFEISGKTGNQAKFRR